MQIWFEFVDSSEEIMMFTMALVVYSLLVGISALVAMLVVSRFARHRALAAPLRKIPGPKPNILFGNVLQFPRPSHGKRIKG